MAVVVKPFPWSPNGWDIEYLQPGDVRHFGASEEALISAGYLSDDAESDVVAESPALSPAAASQARGRRNK